MSMKHKLSRMKNHLTLNETIYDNKKKSDYEQINDDRSVFFLEKWKEYDAKPFFFDGHYSIIREKVYPIEYQHGICKFSELFNVAEWWNKSKIQHPLSCKDNALSEMIFFDTETTGLGGGVGNTIFIIGYARVYHDRVVVTQHFLPNPGAEVAFYQAFLADVGESLKLLHSYNGKAFDWPQVRTQHTLVRDQVPKLPKFGHFDLLHAARRLWKDILPSCRLSIVEQELLHINRSGDTPGNLAPLLYFDYLKEKDPQIIEGVLKHNEIDVLSLIVLYIQISKKLLSKTSNTTQETYEIARWYEKVKEIEQAIELYTKVANCPSRYQNKAIFQLGCLLKKQNRIIEAMDCFQLLIEKEANCFVQACIELAILNEHKCKDVEKALYFTKLAYQRQKQIARLGKETTELAELKRRLDRLQKKQ